jgi:hypothetical protein
VIISHEYRFIFVRTRKTASTSLEIALSQVVGPDAIITSLSPRDEGLRAQLGGRAPQNHLAAACAADVTVPVPPGPGPGIRFYNHMPAAAIRAELGESTWRSYFSFCFERNPWDKVVSLYYHRYKKAPRPPLADFIGSGEMAQAINWPLYADAEAPMVDVVLKYEDLSLGLDRVARYLGLTALGELPRAKSQFRPPASGYRQELDERSRALIGEVYAREIAWHGYQW